MTRACPRRVLVTGASGLIGSHVLHELGRAGYEPRAFSRRPPPADVEWRRGDVRDDEAVRHAMAGCGAVVHAAGLYSYARTRAAEMVQTNLVGTANVLTAAELAGVQRIVVTSTCATCGPVAGRPANEHDAPPPWELSVPYKRTKLEGERLALARAAGGQDVVVVNPTTTVGSGDRGPTPSGAMVRDVVTGRIRGFAAGGGMNIASARDVARGHIQALERGRRGERYILGGDNEPMARLFEMIAELAGVPAPRLPVPYCVALTAAWAAHGAARMRIISEPSLLCLDEVRLARLPMYFSVDKARRELGYTHQPAAQALADAVSWFTKRTTPCVP